MANYELGNLIWRISGDTRDFDKNINNAESRLTKVAGKAKAVGKSLTTFVTAPLIGAGAAATKAASDLGESLNAVNVVFGESADTINAWGEDAAENAGISQSAFNELATVIGSQLKQSGQDIDTVADNTINLTQRAADLASVFNTSVKDATQALGAALRGETEPARRFGINISQAAIESEALASGLVETKDQIDEQIKVQARYNLILKQSSQVQGDFSNTSDSLANSTRIARAELENVAAELGEQLIPIATDAVGAISDVIDRFGDLDEGAQSTIITLGGVAAGIGPVLLGVSSLTKAVQVLSASALFSPVGLIAAAAAATVGLLEFAKAEKRATDESGATAQVLKDQDATLASFTRVAQKADGAFGALSTTQEEAAKTARVSGERYAAMAESLTELEKRTRNAARAAEVAGMRYDALAKSLGATVDEKILTGYQKQIDNIQSLIGLAFDEEEGIERKIEVRQAEIDAIKETALESGALTQKQLNRLNFLEEKNQQYFDRLEQLRSEDDEDEEESIATSLERLEVERDRSMGIVGGFYEYKQEKREDDEEDEEESLEERLERYSDYTNRVLGLFSSLFGAISTGVRQQANREIAEIDRVTDARLKALDDELQAALKAAGVEEKTRKQQLQSELTALKQKLKQETDAEKKAQIEQQIQEKKDAIKRLEITEEYEAEKAKVEKEAEEEKADIKYQAALSEWRLQKATLIADAAAAIIKTASSVPWPLNLPLIAGQIAINGIQLSNLNDAKPERQAFQQGGFVQPRPGTPNTGDQVPARLNPREVVLTEQDAAELLNFIRSPKSQGITINQFNTLNTDSEKNMQRAARQLYPYLDREGARRG